MASPKRTHHPRSAVSRRSVRRPLEPRLHDRRLNAAYSRPQTPSSVRISFQSPFASTFKIVFVSKLRMRAPIAPCKVVVCALSKVYFIRAQSSELDDPHASALRRTARNSRVFNARNFHARIPRPGARFTPSRRASARHRETTLKGHASLESCPEALASLSRVHAAMRVAHASSTFRSRARR
jgi:hypothetical protein